jgi:hypothetical protein
MNRLLHMAVPLAVLVAPGIGAADSNLPVSPVPVNNRPANVPAPGVGSVNARVVNTPALAVPGATAPAANAPTPANPGVAHAPGLPWGPGLPLVPAPGYYPGWAFPFGLPPTAFIEVPFNNSNHYPYGGWTLYPGEPGSGVPSCSAYSQINGTVSPALNAQMVLEKLQAMGIPIEPPETMYLWKNPRIAENVNLPVPRGWRRPPVEPGDKGEPKSNGKMDRNNDKPDKGKDKGKEKDDKGKGDNSAGSDTR